MSSHNPQVSVVTVNYNHGKYLEAYIESLLHSDCSIAEIIIIDNQSTDGSLDILHRYASRVKVVCNETNVGYSQALNQAFHLASSPLVCATGPDITVQPGWLNTLVDQYLRDPVTTFVIASRVLMFDRKTVQSAGGSLHFTGHLTVHEMWEDGKLEDAPARQAVEVGAIDSTSALFDRSKFLEIGGCDPSFFVYHEEFDYCYRARMRGWKCWYQPESIVYHGGGTAEFSSRQSGSYPSARPYLHTRNRWIAILKNYQLRTILSILPAMLLVELLNFALLARNGLYKSYLNAWGGVWHHRKEISQARSALQPSRRSPDSLLLSADPLTISPVLLNNHTMKWLKGLLDGFLSVYWRALKLVLYP